MFPLQKFSLSFLVLPALCGGMLVAVGNLIVHAGSVAGGISLAAALLICGLSLTRQRRACAADLVTMLPLFLLVICLGTVVAGSLSLFGGVLAVAAAAFLLFERTSPLPAPSLTAPSVESREFDETFETGESILIEEDFLSEENEEEDSEEDYEESLSLRFPPGETVQQWRRHQTDSIETLEGTLTADFLAGQKQRYLHVPFVPFFGSPPTGYCECPDDGLAEASLDLVHSYGARLSIRRKGNPALPATITVFVSLEANRTARRAA